MTVTRSELVIKAGETTHVCPVFNFVPRGSAVKLAKHFLRGLAFFCQQWHDTVSELGYGRALRSAAESLSSMIVVVVA